MSQKRAASNQFGMNVIQHRRIQALYDEHIATGILRVKPGQREPDSDQVWNGDEVGFDPKGNWCSVLTDSRTEVCRVSTGEKAPFWVTAWFVTRADGQVPLSPTLVHQGPELSAFLLMNLPEDWIVHATPSGYMDQHGFFKIAAQIVRYEQVP
jgi:hypothetical protein